MERKKFSDRLNALKSEADSWTTAWKDIQRYLVPTRGFFDLSNPNWGATIDHKVLIDGHGTRSLERLASGMTSGLTSPSRPWFRLGLPDDDLQQFLPVKEWLDDVQQRMMAVFAKSNIYGALHGVYSEVGSFGTAAVAILPDYNDVIRARLYTCGEYFLGTGADSRVNAFARLFWMTVAQLVAEYGKDNVSDQVRVDYENGRMDRWVQVAQLIEENSGRSDSPIAKNKRFRSVHWEHGSSDEKFLRKAGFDEFPILAPRWDTTTTADVYGRGPGWNALGDIKMLQKMQKDKLIGLDKVVDPPVQADGNVSDQVNVLPGGVTRSSATSPNAGLRPTYQVQPDFSAIGAEISETKRAISEAFFADLFVMIANANKANMTAREIVERHEEKLLMLGPVLERLEAELLDPLIDRTFGIMLRAGLIPPPPDELQGTDLRVEYISMLAQAQKAVGTTAIEQTVAFVGNLAAVKPEILDKLDEDEAIDNYSEMTGIPPKIIRSKEVVDAIRQKKQQEKQAAEVAATLPGMVQGAKVLSETKVGTGSALDALLTGAPAPQTGA